MAISAGFSDYCCELLSGVGPCLAKRMFGGWGISVDGMNIAVLADLGKGETLYLKVSDSSRAAFEREGCFAFQVEMRGKLMGMGYYSAPADAMESPALMLPWGRLALQAAIAARAAKKPKTTVAKKKAAAKPAKPVPAKRKA